MGVAPEPGSGGFPEEVRQAIAQSYNTVYAAINDKDWTAGVDAAQTVLKLLEPFPLTLNVPVPVWVEKAWSLYVLGMAARARGDHDETALYMQQAASVAPNEFDYFPNRQARWQLGVALVKLGRFTAAREELRKALVHSLEGAEKAELLYWRGVAWDLEGDDDRARLAYLRALHEQAQLHTDDSAVVPAWIGAVVKRLASGDRVRTMQSADTDASQPVAGRGFWAPWIAAGTPGVLAFAGLSLLSIIVWGFAAFELFHAPPYEGIVWWIALLAFPLLLLLQPSFTHLSIASPVGSLSIGQPPGSTPSSTPPAPNNIDGINISL
jgi:tetratricopeptide (TPR) repeat protein